MGRLGGLSPMRALLDTCTFLWLANDQSGLTQAARQVLGRPEAQLQVSDITLTEIHRLIRRGVFKFAAPVDLLRWFELALTQHRLTCVPVTPAIAHAAELLPPIHKDPADRLIIATAQAIGAEIVTPDGLITRYPGVRTLW